jgi:hypothetical protein
MTPGHDLRIGLKRLLGACGRRARLGRLAHPVLLVLPGPAILEQFADLPLAAFIVAAIGVMIAWAMVYGELFLLTRSVWPAVLMHSVEDAFVNPLFTEQRIVVNQGADWLVSPVNGIISVALFAALGVGLTRHRRTHQS